MYVHVCIHLTTSCVSHRLTDLLLLNFFVLEFTVIGGQLETLKLSNLWVYISLVVISIIIHVQGILTSSYPPTSNKQAPSAQNVIHTSAGGQPV